MRSWKFEKFMTLKIQTDELERIQATSADNINMMVTSTVNWRIFDVETAATMAAETMATTGKAGDVNADISKLRRDVLKQAIASLAAFIGSVNYSCARVSWPNQQLPSLLVPQGTARHIHAYVLGMYMHIDMGMNTSRYPTPPHEGSGLEHEECGFVQLPPCPTPCL